MSALIIPLEPDRMRRQSRPRSGARIQVLRIAAMLGLAWVLGWGWRVAPAYQAARRARVTAQARHPGQQVVVTVLVVEVVLHAITWLSCRSESQPIIP